jgi:hypothetical protein
VIRDEPARRLSVPGTDRPRFRAATDLLPFDLRQKQRERAVEDRTRITVRDLATEQRLYRRSLSWLSLPIVNWTR